MAENKPAQIIQIYTVMGFNCKVRSVQDLIDLGIWQPSIYIEACYIDWEKEGIKFDNLLKEL